MMMNGPPQPAAAPPPLEAFAPPPPPRRRRDWRYFFACLGVVAVTAAILVSTLDAMGLTDDDDFYVPAAKDYITWVEQAVKGALKGDFNSFRKADVDRRFNNNHEHPAVAKLVMGATWLVFNKWLGWFGQIDAARLGIILFAVFLNYLIFRFTWENFGPRAAFFAVAAFLTFPRSFFHSHVGTLDIATASTSFFVAYAAWRAEKSRAWIVIAGVAFGVAIGTKLNGPFAVLPLVAYWLYRWRQSAVLKDASTLRFKRMLAIGLAMAILALPVFIALWPWVWFDTLDRLAGFFRFHYRHYGIRLLYFGEVYLKPFAPWRAPFVYAAVTMPVVTLVLGLYGFWQGLRQLLPGNLRRFPKGPGAPEDYALFCAFGAFFAIGVVAFAGTPKYGGVKLFQPMYPFFAVLAGYAFELLVRRLQALWPIFRQETRAWVPAVGALLLLPGLLGMMRVYPFMLSYFSPLIGNLPGATEAGMERQYYDMCYRTTIAWWDEQGPARARIAYEPNNVEYRRTYPWYKRDGKLKHDITVVEPDQAEYLILTHERRWSHYFELLNQYRQYPVVRTQKAWGVPLYTVFDLRKDRPPARPPRPPVPRKLPARPPAIKPVLNPPTPRPSPPQKGDKVKPGKKRGKG
ncbi:MAG: hypothetical protein C4523_16685 [Myxococcales bacterium]|nr:MAG: hypothetical protein C4523_16685 [Myxococcales bacterium]